MGKRSSKASSTDRCVTGTSTWISTSWPTCANVRRCWGSSTRIFAAITTSLHVCLLHVETFPIAALAGPDFSEDAFRFRDFASGFAFVLGHVCNQSHIRCQWLHGEISQVVTQKIVLIHSIDFR